MTKEEMQNSYIEMLIQDLEKHSFDYWESTQDEMVESLRNLQQENEQLKEKIILLKASEPMLEFAKQTYKTNWNELKKWLEEELTEGRSIENQWLMGCYDQIKEILNKMQELEGSDSNE